MQGNSYWLSDTRLLSRAVLCALGKRRLI